MNLSEIVDTVRSGVVHINYMKDQERVGSGTGFMVDGFLVTNYHVYSGPKDSVVLIRFHDSSTETNLFLDGYQLTYSDFSSMIKAISSENSYDYAVIDVPELRKRNLYNFSFGELAKKRIGETVFFLGYPLEHRNLVCHAGFISSFYKSGVVDVIQLDASVNQSNSGGPLIDLETGKVIGIITRKATGLTKLFAELRSALKSNMDLFNSAKGVAAISGIDLMEAAVVSQAQILQLTYEIERAANVGIGYAFSIEQLRQEPIFPMEIDR